MAQFGSSEELYTYDTMTHRADLVICGDKYQAISLFHLTNYRSLVDKTLRPTCWVVERNAVNHDACGLVDVEFTGFIDNLFFDHFDEAKAAFVALVKDLLV